MSLLDETEASSGQPHNKTVTFFNSVLTLNSNASHTQFATQPTLNLYSIYSRLIRYQLNFPPKIGCQKLYSLITPWSIVLCGGLTHDRGASENNSEFLLVLMATLIHHNH